MMRSGFIGKNTAIRLMNSYGSSQIPFLFMISFSKEQSLVRPLTELEPGSIGYFLNGLGNQDAIMGKEPDFTFEKFPISFEAYKLKFDKVLKEIHYGNSYLLNLTCPTPINTSLTLHDIFLHSKAKYKLWLNNLFVLFSPETFVTIQNGRISSFPMKGTIDAGLPGASEQILSDPKETAEHYTIVDLIRNDLSMVASDVEVKRFRYLDKLTTNFGELLQVSSEISGVLPDDYPGRIGEIVFSLLPAGSVSGAPKSKTVDIIREAEQYERGFYTGVFGIFDGINLDSAVMIRFIEQSTGGLIFKSGGGITSFSKAEDEYREMIQKVYVPID